MPATESARSGGTAAAAAEPRTPALPAARPAGASDPAELDRLAHALYGRLRGHLATDLLVGRERANHLTDL